LDNKQSFLKGAAILTAATILVKIIGMFYKIPLGNVLGAVGLSYFMTAYSIFNPISSLSTAGFPVAVSCLASENAARGRWRDVKRIFRVSFTLFVVTGLVGFALMFFGAGRLAGMVGNPGAALSVAAMAPAIFFCCIMSAYRGYYQGMNNMSPTAASQVVESVAKLICGIGFAFRFLNRGLEEYARQGTVYGAVAADEAAAGLLALPYAAAGAVLGVTVSTAMGAAFLFLRHALRGDGVSRERLRRAPAPAGYTATLKRLVLLALPVCLASAVAHVTNLIDVATIINRVGVAMQRDSAAVLGMYRGLLPQGLPEAGVPSFLYGAFSYTNSLFNLVPALTAPLGISALPGVASLWALGSRRQSVERIQSVVKLAALAAIPAGLGIAALAEPILSLLYPLRLQETAIAAPLLRGMGVAGVFVGITTPMASVFQALGRADIPVKLMGMGAAVKVGCNYLLLAVPALNIRAASLGTTACYAFILLAGCAWLGSVTGERVRMGKVFLKPLICGILCALAANTSFALLHRLIPSRAVCLCAVAIGGVIYVIFALFLRVISKNEAEMLLKGKKIVKILEKLSFLG